MSNFKENRCPECKIGYIFITPEEKTYLIHCTDCNYTHIRSDLRCRDRRTLVDRRSIARYFRSKIGAFLERQIVRKSFSTKG